MHSAYHETLLPISGAWYLEWQSDEAGLCLFNGFRVIGASDRDYVLMHLRTPEPADGILRLGLLSCDQPPETERFHASLDLRILRTGLDLNFVVPPRHFLTLRTDDYSRIRPIAGVRIWTKCQTILHPGEKPLEGPFGPMMPKPGAAVMPPPRSATASGPFAADMQQWQDSIDLIKVCFHNKDGADAVMNSHPELVVLLKSSLAALDAKHIVELVSATDPALATAAAKQYVEELVRAIEES